MVKQLKGVPVKPDMQSAQMRRDAALMQGVSSRLQIKRELQEASKKPPEPVKSKSKRLYKPVADPEFITADAGYGRLSDSKVMATGFGQMAQNAFGHIGNNKDQSYNDYDFL